MNLYYQYQNVLKEFGVEDLQKIANAWREPHRFYHTEQHLSFLLTEIEKLFKENRIRLYEKKCLLMTAFFHDIIYDPTRQDNEEKSVDFFKSHTKPHKHSELIVQMILDTKHHKPKERLSKFFSALDMAIVSHSNFAQLLVWERQIFKEYQFTDYSLYRSVRIGILKEFQKSYPKNASNLQTLIDYLAIFRPKIGVYPGSFNPFHNGHLNILEKAEKIFDKVIVARGVNPDKQDINTDKLQNESLKYRQFENFTGFLTDYITLKEELAEITLIRGLRNGDDLDYEVNQLRFMEDMKENLKIIFITCDKQFEHISSSAIKNLDRIKSGFSDKYMPR